MIKKHFMRSPQFLNFGRSMAPHRPERGSRRAARAATDVTGWCVGAGGGEPPRCSRRRGCTHAPGAAEYCTLVGGASDADSDGDASLPSAEPERRFPCGEAGCEYTATKSSHLNRHTRTHSDERPFACDEPGCEYRATEAGNLNKHKRTHSGERPFACDEAGCAYRTTQAGTLKAHKRMHSGERPYACDEPGCEYTATTASHLKAHKQRTHS
jgi:hypothetical protein